MLNFKFGPVCGDKVRMSLHGIAIKTSNGWIAYDEKTNELINVDIINFDISKIIYKMPVALAAIAPGDILYYGDKYVFVRSINDDGTIGIIDYDTSAVTNILPVKSPFGFNFFTKICALFDFDKIDASSENPFGKMLPFILANNKDFDPLIFFLMNQKDIDNPMMLYFLMNQDKSKDILPFLLMSGGSMLFFDKKKEFSPESPSADEKSPI